MTEESEHTCYFLHVNIPCLKLCVLTLYLSPLPSLSRSPCISLSILPSFKNNCEYAMLFLHTPSPQFSPSRTHAFLNHMLKASPSFSPDRSTYHILLSHSPSYFPSVCKSLGHTLSSYAVLILLFSCNQLLSSFSITALDYLPFSSL